MKQGIEIGQQVMEVCSKRDTRHCVGLFNEMYIAMLVSAGVEFHRGLSILLSTEIEINTFKMKNANKALHTQ
jgi:hypothetical protein